MFCSIWYHFYNLKSWKNTHGGVILLVNENHHSSMGVFLVFKIIQMVPNREKRLIWEYRWISLVRTDSIRSRSPLGELNISTVTYHAYFFHLESNNQVWNNGKRFYQKYLRGSKPESTGRIFCLVCRASYLTIFKKLRHSCLIGS